METVGLCDGWIVHETGGAGDVTVCNDVGVLENGILASKFALPTTAPPINA